MAVNLREMSNGIKVLSEEVHHAPVIAIQAWVEVGAADETPDMAGAAHLHEHMLFKGTGKRGVGEIARAVEASGGEINAWTSFDQTVYHVVLRSDETDVGLDILSDVLRNSAFDKDELEREIEVVVEEIQRAEDSPSRRLSNALFRTAYQNHRYGFPVLGSPESVRAMTRERILDFYHSHYRPEQITVVAVGDFKTAELEQRIERFFGDWVNPDRAPLPTRAREQAQTEFRYELLKEDVKQTRFSMAWHIPEVEHQDIPALDVLSMVLGYGESSRLYRAVRQEGQLVNDVHSYAYTPKDPGLFVVGASLKEENLKAAFKATCEEVFRCRNGVAEEELEKAKVVILSESAYLRETVQGQARKLGFYQVVAGNFRFEERYRERIGALSVEDIERVARTYLNTTPTLVIQVPEENAGPEASVMEAMIRECEGLVGRSSFERNQSMTKALRPRPKSAGIGVSKGALEVTSATLPNGCRLLIREEESPVVGIRAAALGGLRWEGAAENGLGGLFSSLWATTTPTLSEEELSERLAFLGGGLSAFVGRNSLGIRGEFLKGTALPGMELFCDVLLESRFEEALLDREREVAFEQIRNRPDQPASMAFEAFAKALYPSHPFGRPMVGTEETLAGLTVGSLEAYQHQLATPDKMVISVVGDVDSAEVIDRLAARLGEVTGGALPPAPTEDSPPQSATPIYLPNDKQQSHVLIGAQGTRIDSRDKYVFEVLTTILSGQSGRLFMDLRDKKSLAYTVSAASVEALDPGFVYLYMATSPEKLPVALGGLYEHLDRLRNDLVLDEELTRARRYLIGTHSIDLQRGGARAMLMALGECLGLGYDHYTAYVDGIKDIGVEDIRRVAQTYLSPESLVQVVVGSREPGAVEG